MSSTMYTQPLSSVPSYDMPLKVQAIAKDHTGPENVRCQMHAGMAGGRHRKAHLSLILSEYLRVLCSSCGMLVRMSALHHPWPHAGAPISGRARCSMQVWIRTQTLPECGSAPWASHSNVACLRASQVDLSSHTPNSTIIRR